ncbi:MAG: AAA family ATPase [Cyanobacteria bacterium P01_D01_bin.56]
MTELASNRSIRIEKSAVGSAIVSGNGNTIYVIHQTTERQNEPDLVDTSTKISTNPYKGLSAFRESDADRYFGRESQVERLWQRFQDLYDQSTLPRFLPVLGPSGCGKSSLVRAGLIPELARRSLMGKETMRAIVMLPGESPLKALAGVLARLTQDDQTPEVIKKRRYEEELRTSAELDRFDFLQDVAETLPDIQAVPLVVLVDQFEEVYSLCQAPDEREAFIKTLLYAASSPTGHVTVVITIRSDFLGETQRHQSLNQVIGSDQSMIVPAMTEAELHRAISEPAKQAGHPIDEATISLLIRDTEGREGALPLLQFALTRIWEELNEGKSPVETYREMDGVGGALAKRAQVIYEKLSESEKSVARRIFIGLIQIGEGSPDTRRRAAVDSLVASKDKPETVSQVIRKFTSPGARLITLSSQDKQEVVEVTHEALFVHWSLLKNWLESSRDDIRLQRRIQEAGQQWKDQGCPEGSLWRPPELELAQNYYSRSYQDMTQLQIDFIDSSAQAYTKTKNAKRRNRYLLSALGLISVVAFIFSQQEISKRRFQEQLASLLMGSNDPELINIMPRAIQLGDRQIRNGRIPEAIEIYKTVLKAIENYTDAIVTHETSLENVQLRKVEDIHNGAEQKLAEIVEDTYITRELLPELHRKKIGKIDDSINDVTFFEDQYTEGALQTTYRILMREPGLRLDQNDNGRLNSEELVYLPCHTLKVIEELWRQATSDHCGFYGEDFYTASNCEELSGATLSSVIFHPDFSDIQEIESHLRDCEIYER